MLQAFRSEHVDHIVIYNLRTLEKKPVNLFWEHKENNGYSFACSFMSGHDVKVTHISEVLPAFW